MSTKVITAIIIVVVIIGAGILLQRSRSGDSTARENSPTNSINPTNTINPAPPTSPVSVQTVAVSGNEFSFSPSEIRVKKGAPVKIVFTNTGKYPHNWLVDEFSAGTAIINLGETADVTFTPNKTGTFQYYCGVGTHRAKGMVGNLIVE